MKMIKSSFIYKFFLAFTFFIFMITLCFSIFYMTYQQKSITDGLIKKGELLANIISKNTKIGVFSENRELLHEPVEGIVAQEFVIECSIYNLEGEPLKGLRKYESTVQEESRLIEKQFFEGLLKRFISDRAPLCLEDHETLQFWAPITSISGYSIGASMYFFKPEVSPNDRVIGFANVVLDKEGLTRQLKALMVKSILIGFIFWIVGTIITYFIVKGITKPLNRLTESVKSVGCGEFVKKITVETEDEIGKLAGAFNNMVESLQERDEQLQEVHKELEQRVKDRTAELFDTNKELENKIEERRRIEKRLELSLKEKEALIQELYHRTKNNMQVIRELLYIQSLHIEDDKILEIFKDTENRIMSMALVHQKLYKSNDLSKIDLKYYIKDLCSALIDSYSICPGRISFKLEVENVFVTIDTAIPCGMVINELVSNSLKHAFPRRKEGEIKILLKQSIDKDYISLIISDNGVGVQEGFNLKAGDTLGLQLVVNLIENQLSGTIDSDISSGIEYRIQFREPEYKKKNIIIRNKNSNEQA